jgi:hypothetical protein
LFFFLFRRSNRAKKDQMENNGNKDMYEYTPDQGYGAAGTAGATGAAGIGARAFVPPADNNVQPYADDFMPHSAQPAHDEGYYYSPTGAGYSQQSDNDFYDNRYQPAHNNSNYYGYQNDPRQMAEYNDPAYHVDGYSDSTMGAGGVGAGAATSSHDGARFADVSDKTYMFAGEHNNDPRRVFGKPDARE